MLGNFVKYLHLDKVVLQFIFRPQILYEKEFGRRQFEENSITLRIAGNAPRR